MSAPLYPTRVRQVTDDPEAGTTRAVVEVLNSTGRVIATCRDAHDARRISEALEAADVARWLS